MWSLTGSPDDGDIPVEPCYKCFLGSKTAITGPIEGEECFECSGGEKVPFTGAIDQCNVCVNGQLTSNECGSSVGVIQVYNFDESTVVQIEKNSIVYISPAARMPHFVAEVNYPDRSTAPSSVVLQFLSSHARVPASAVSGRYCDDDEIDNKDFESQLDTDD